jgi:hypothetical protein
MLTKQCRGLCHLTYVGLFSLRQSQDHQSIQDFEYIHDSNSELEEVALEEADSHDKEDRMSISGLDVGRQLGIYFWTAHVTPIQVLEQDHRSTRGLPNSDEEITDSEAQDDSDGDDDNDDDMEQEGRSLAAMVTQMDLQAAIALNNEEVEVFGGGADEDPLVVESCIENVRITQQYTQAISSATLDNSGLNEDVVERLRNPLEGEVDLSDPDVRLSLDILLACSHASEATYNSICDGIKRRFPDVKIMSHYLAKKTLERVTGVTSVLDDMCVNSCQAFTGPLAARTMCSECGEARYHHAGPDQRPKARKQVCTIPLGPQIQALRRSRTGAIAMRYRERKTQEMRLPNGQVARSRFKEERSTLSNQRVSRNIKVFSIILMDPTKLSFTQLQLNNEVKYGEVLFFFLNEAVDNTVDTTNYYALVSIYGPPNAGLLRDSSHALQACAYYGDDNLHVIRVASILSVVSMQPLPVSPDDVGLDNHWFVVEKSGIDDTELTGYIDTLEQEI